MVILRGPVRIKNKEAGRTIWQVANSHMTEYFVKIVTGEGFSGNKRKVEGILRDKEFLLTIENFMKKKKRLMIICHVEGGKQELIKILLSYYSKEQIRKIKEAIKKGNLVIYLSSQRPRWHFTVIDGKHLFVQRQHDPNAPSKKKDWLYTDDRILPPKYSNFFDELAKECSPLLAEDII
jgi:ribosomal protein S8